MRIAIIILLSTVCSLEAFALEPLEITNYWRTGEKKQGSIDATFARSTLGALVNECYGSFSTIETQVENSNYEAALIVLYSILEASDTAKEDMRISEEQEIWLSLLGNLLLDRWQTAYPKDIDSNPNMRELRVAINKNPKCHSPQKLLNVVKWAIANKSDALVWVKSHHNDGVMLISTTSETINNLFAHVVYTALKRITRDSIPEETILSLSMAARIPSYKADANPFDYARETLDYRAIDILLRSSKKVKEVEEILLKVFDPTSSKNVINNLRIIDSLMRYGLTDIAKELTLRGNSSTPSLLLDIALRQYDAMSYEEQEEIRPLIHRIQKFIF